MAQYTEEFLAAARHGYENTDQPMRELARELGIGITTLSTLAENNGWAKRSKRRRGLPPERQLLAEAQKLAAAAAHSRGSGNPEKELGPRFRGDERDEVSQKSEVPPTPDPSPPFAPLTEGGEQNEPASPEQADLHAQLRHILTQLISNEQAAVASGARSPQSVRTLATMIQAMRALNGGASGLTPAAKTIENDDDDDLPRDLDAFRDALAKRIDALFASTVDAVHARANSERADTEATE